MWTSQDQNRQQELRKEAVLIGRRGIGRRLQMTLQPVVDDPIPDEWLYLLEAADRRDDEADEPRRRTG